MAETATPADVAKRIERAARLRWIPIADMAVAPLAQREMKQYRVDRIVSNFDLEQIGTPTVNLRDGSAYVIDGQHRVEALKAIGWADQSVQCWTYEGLSEAEEAEKFLKLNDTLAVSAFDRFKVGVQAGRVEECDVDRIVRAHGLRVAQDQGEGSISAPGTLLKVYRRCGPAVLSKTLKCVSLSYGDAGLSAEVIDGISLVLQRYGSELDPTKATERFSSARGGVYGLTNRAEQIRLRTGNQKAHCIAAAAVEIYNAGRGGKKLATWWREDGDEVTNVTAIGGAA